MEVEIYLKVDESKVAAYQKLAEDLGDEISSLKIWDLHQWKTENFNAWHVLKSCQENKLPWIIIKSSIPAVPTNLNTKFNVQGVLKRLLKY